MERVMDGVMDAEGGEKMRVQIFFREKGSLFRQCWISGLATAHCSACFHTKHSALAPNQLKPTNVSEPPQTTRFLFASDAFAQPLFSLFIFLTPIHCLLPLASSFKFSLPSLCFSFAVSPFLQPSGDTPGCGIGPGLQVSIVILCVLMSLVLTVVQLGQAALAQGLFTVYPKLKALLCGFSCVCLFLNEYVWLCLFIFMWQWIMN